MADAALRLLAVPVQERTEALGTALLGLVYAAANISAHDRAMADAMRQAPHFASMLKSQTGVNLWSSLGHYYFVRGLFPLAREAHELALALAWRALGERHPDTLTAMNNLAVTLRTLGDLPRAHSLHEWALAASHELVGARHPNTLIFMDNLASTLHARGDLAGARALQEQALAALNEALGERHPNTLKSMDNLAATLHALGDLPGHDRFKSARWRCGASSWARGIRTRLRA